LQPIIEISQGGGGWPDIATDVLILVGLDLLLIGVMVLVLKKTSQFGV